MKPNKTWKRTAAIATGACCVAAALAIPGVLAAPSPADSDDAAQVAPQSEEQGAEEAAEPAAEESEPAAGADAETPAAGTDVETPAADADAAGGDTAGDAGAGAGETPGDAGTNTPADAPADAPADTPAADPADTPSADPASSADADTTTPGSDTSATPDEATSTASDAASSSAGSEETAEGTAPTAADGEGVASSVKDTAASSTADAQAKNATQKLAEGGALEAGTYVLDGNVKLAQALDIPAGTDVTIDLAGHTLDASGVTTSAVTCEGTLTLIDSADGGVVTGGGVARTGNGGFVSLSGTGAFALESGTVTGFAISGSGGAVSLADSSSATIAGGTISSCSAQAGGAVSISAGTAFAMPGGTISSCSASGNGGALVLADGAGATIAGGTITACSAQAGGAASAGASSTLQMSGGTISQCRATGNGGAIYTAGTFAMTGGLVGSEDGFPGLSADNVLSAPSDFGNQAGGNGGGIYGDSKSSISVSGSASVSGNYAKVSIADGPNYSYCGGGGICSLGSVEVGGEASVSGNVASNGGGIYMKPGSSTLTITGGIFSSNIAFFPGTKADMTQDRSFNRGNGAGVFTCSGATNISSATFAGNRASRFGGAIANGDQGGAALSAEGCTITDNAALYREGGGIAFYNVGTAVNTVSNCTISNNYSGKNGGGIFTRKDVTISSGTTISGNSCDNNGGGVYVENGTFTLDGGTIGGDSDAANHAGERGGGVYAGNSTLIKSGTISYNYASFGGGVYAAARFSIAGGSIDHNFAEGTDADGGGVYVANSSAFNMTGGSITDNAANGNSGAGHGNGGGIYLASSTTVSITSGTISGNVAAGHGGGMDVGGASASAVTIGVKNHPDGHACPQITDNKSSLRGGGLCIHGAATTNVYCCAITDNDATNDGTSSSIYQEKGILNLGDADSATNAAVVINGSVTISGAGTMNVYKDASVGDATLTATGGVVNDYRQGAPTLCAITYKPGYDGSGQSAQTAQVTTGIEVTLPTNLFTRAGYRITGWYAEGDTSKTPVEQPYKPTGDVTLVALWEEVAQDDAPGTLVLTPTCAGTGDRALDRFTYQIAGTTAHGDKVSLCVEAKANESVSVLLNPGTYTVTPTAGWQWRYVGAASYSVTIDSDETETLSTPLRLSKTDLQSVMTEGAN